MDRGCDLTDPGVAHPEFVQLSAAASTRCSKRIFSAAISFCRVRFWGTTSWDQAEPEPKGACSTQMNTLLENEILGIHFDILALQGIVLLAERLVLMLECRRKRVRWCSRPGMSNVSTGSPKHSSDAIRSCSPGASCRRWSVLGNSPEELLLACVTLCTGQLLHRAARRTDETRRSVLVGCMYASTLGCTFSRAYGIR